MQDPSCKNHAVSGKNMKMRNPLVLDLDFFFFFERVLVLLPEKNLPVFSLELPITLIALLCASIKNLSTAFIDSGCRCQQWQQLPLVIASLVLEWME